MMASLSSSLSLWISCSRAPFLRRMSSSSERSSGLRSTGTVGKEGEEGWENEEMDGDRKTGSMEMGENGKMVGTERTKLKLTWNMTVFKVCLLLCISKMIWVSYWKFPKHKTSHIQSHVPNHCSISLSLPSLFLLVSPLTDLYLIPPFCLSSQMETCGKSGGWWCASHCSLDILEHSTLQPIHR